MKKSFLLVAFFLLQVMVYGQLAEKIELTSDNKLIGLGEQHILPSKILNEDRPIIVSAPSGYEESKANYPVLYVLDGLGNIKHTIGTVELLTESGVIPPMIIVAIESLDRSRDLTPSKAGENVYGGSGNAGIPQSGGAPNFLQFIKEELIPYIETNFRTHPYRILEGHSFGGLFSVYALMASPETFDGFIVEAPALWWNKEEMTQMAKEFYSENQSLDKAVYFGIGGGDGWGMRQELIRYVEVVKENQPKNFRWKHEEVGDEDHDASRLLLNYYGLKFLFSDLKMTEDLTNNFSQNTFLAAEKELMEKYGERARRPAGDYVDLVFKLEKEGSKADMIKVLNRAVETYPRYIGLLTWLAKLYEETDQIPMAISTYEKGIVLSKRLKLGQEEDLAIEINRLKK